jgi:hypothetical protein
MDITGQCDVTVSLLLIVCKLLLHGKRICTVRGVSLQPFVNQYHILVAQIRLLCTATRN